MKGQNLIEVLSRGLRENGALYHRGAGAPASAGTGVACSRFLKGLTVTVDARAAALSRFPTQMK